MKASANLNLRKMGKESAELYLGNPCPPKGERYSILSTVN